MPKPESSPSRRSRAPSAPEAPLRKYVSLCESFTVSHSQFPVAELIDGLCARVRPRTCTHQLRLPDDRRRAPPICAHTRTRRQGAPGEILRQLTWVFSTRVSGALIPSFSLYRETSRLTLRTLTSLASVWPSCTTQSLAAGCRRPTLLSQMLAWRCSTSSFRTSAGEGF